MENLLSKKFHNVEISFKISQDLMTLYNSLLIQKAIPEKYHPYYRKWLRYYLDFFQKYGFKPLDTKSLMPFINKLKEKK
jgi:hypothetical protein